MIKLVVSDFDGTLMPYGQRAVSDSVASWVNGILDGGREFAVSSGRTYSELKAFLPEFVGKIYFICADGAYCVKDGRVIYSRHIPDSELSSFSARNGASFVFHGAEKNYSLGDIPNEALSFSPAPISRISEIKEKIYKVTSYGADVKLPAYSALRMHWDGGENASAQYVNRYCDKGAALSDLQIRLMLTKFDTACIGDSGNDIAMMKNAKLSLCVGDRSTELAAICTQKINNVEEAFQLITNY